MHSVENILVALQQAWNAGDGVAWAANFAEDADFIDVLGRVQHGRDTIAREHQKIFDTIYRESRIEIRQLTSHTVGEGVLLVHTASRLQVPSGPRAGETHAVQTKVLTHGRIRAFQNTIRTGIAGFAGHDDDLASLSPLEWQHAD